MQRGYGRLWGDCRLKHTVCWRTNSPFDRGVTEAPTARSQWCGKCTRASRSKRRARRSPEGGLGDTPCRFGQASLRRGIHLEVAETKRTSSRLTATPRRRRNVREQGLRPYAEDRNNVTASVGIAVARSERVASLSTGGGNSGALHRRPTATATTPMPGALVRGSTKASAHALKSSCKTGEDHKYT